jgi:hypothetical protein
MRDGHAQFRAEIAEFQATTPEEAMQMCAGASSAAASERPAASLGDGRPLGQRACPSTLAHRPLPTDRARREGRLAAYPCSDESCRVFSAHYLGWILRKGEVLASRQVLQSTGVVDVDCPVCLGVLRAGEGVVTFHILECGHRCATPFLFPGAPFRQRGACRRCQCPPPLHIALSRCVCYTGSTRTAGSRSKRGGPRPAPCAGARSVAARRAPRASLRSRATWPDVAPQLHLPAPVVAEL